LLAVSWKVFISAIWRRLNGGLVSGDWLRNKVKVSSGILIDLGPPSEELNKLTNGIYQKVAGSRAIGGYLNLENNSSRSFIVFLSGIKKVLGN